MSKSKLNKAFSNPNDDDVSAGFLSTSEREDKPEGDKSKSEQPRKSPYGGRAAKPKDERARKTPAYRKNGGENKSSETAVVALSSDLKKKLEKLSLYQGVSMSQVMRNALEAYINAHYEDAKRDFRAMLDEEE